MITFTFCQWYFWSLSLSQCMLSLERWQRTQSRWRTHLARPRPLSNGTSWPSRFLAPPLTGIYPSFVFPIVDAVGTQGVFVSIDRIMSCFCFANNEYMTREDVDVRFTSNFVDCTSFFTTIVLTKILTLSNIQGTNRLSSVVHRINRNSLQLQPSGRSGDSFKDTFVVGS